MAARINLLNEPELPAPHEKLLRAPTFWEKYGWLKWVLIVAILVGVIDYGIIKVLNSETTTTFPQSTNQAVVSDAPSPLPTADPTLNWNTYTSPLGKFSFKYPDGYTITENAAKNSVQLTSNQLPNNAEFVLTLSFKPVIGDMELQTLVTKNPFCPTIVREKATPSVLNGKQPAELYADTSCGKTPTSVIYTLNQNTLYIITVQSKTQFMDIKSYTDQIFSTLTFREAETNINPTGNQTFCTADAKLCPDGSWVGRTGPQCEFVCPAKN
jgi:hypothetical protein